LEDLVVLKVRPGVCVGGGGFFRGVLRFTVSRHSRGGGIIKLFFGYYGRDKEKVQDCARE
jgi:hypothetical protein